MDGVVTEPKAERLALLLEELGEAIQIVGKIQRHGWTSAHPNLPSVPNSELLANELGDVMASVSMMIEAGDVSGRRIDIEMSDKLGRVKRYLHCPVNVELANSCRLKIESKA